MFRRRASSSRRGSFPGLASVCDDVVYPHVFANGDREVGGVLVGVPAREGGPPRVTGAIPAVNAGEHRAQLTFTHDAWEHVHAELDRRFSREDHIVGWYHSHPGFGIFLSEQDLFIHRNFFADRGQCALVVDPQRGTEGLFAWRRGDVVPVFERRTPRRWPAVAQAQSAPPRAARWLLRLAALLTGLAIGLSAHHQLLDAPQAAQAPARPAAPSAHKPNPKSPALPRPRREQRTSSRTMQMDPASLPAGSDEIDG